MNSFDVGLGVALVAAGSVAVAAAGRGRHASDTLAYLRQVEEMGTPVPVGDPRLAQPIARRLLGPAGRGLLRRVSALYPPANLDRLHGQLLAAGMSGVLRAEELATIQALSAAAGVLGAIAYVALARPPARFALLALLILPVCGVLGPRAWVQGRARRRSESIQRDLPDVLDLLTISVEAGLGLEQAIGAASAQMESALADELGFTLREMSLGLSRRDALENLRQRCPVEDLSNFVVVLTQADALGMPIGRVLRAQAEEMRNKRRQRARQQAAKLPVKILFPLTAFIFPPMMIIILGPAMRSIMTALKL